MQHQFDRCFCNPPKEIKPDVKDQSIVMSYDLKFVLIAIGIVINVGTLLKTAVKMTEWWASYRAV